MAYKSILEFAQIHSQKVRIHGGFIPRSYARVVMREGLEAGLAQAKEKDYVAPNETLIGSEEHYNFFDSLISGRDMNNKNTPPGDQFRKMFPAQVIKDASMAYQVSKLMQSEPADSTFFVIMGFGHMGHGFGVPERIWQLEKDSKE
jgi:uncharacterized iron-regulated protein